MRVFGAPETLFDGDRQDPTTGARLAGRPAGPYHVSSTYRAVRRGTDKWAGLMSKMLIVDPGKCTSCRLCELACSERNAGCFRPTRSNIQVTIHVDDAFYFPAVCIQCDDAPCVAACPEGALVRDPGTGVVLVVEENCNECGLCVPVCPYGAIRCVGGLARKCDLCGGDPECVRFCAPGALRYEAAEAWPAADRQVYGDRMQELAQEGRS